jgi:hypothetical protein
VTNYRDPAHFERLYQSDPDPWKFATSDYERDKYAATLATLLDGTTRRFSRGFEIGCSIGVLTRQFAGLCDTMLGVDVSRTALEDAERRCADVPHLTFTLMRAPQEWPNGSFDLIVFSEVLYYLGLDGIDLAARRTLESLAPGGTVVLVDWLGPTDGACTGDEAAARFIAACAPRLSPQRQQRAEKYRIDVLE